jgi:protein tyrosine phosphatase (PTP) superfamily phosphohydrolase (DUF442 family)
MNGCFKESVLATVILLLAAGLAFGQTGRDRAWAVKMNLAGVPNFYQLTTNFYRGAQPTAAGMAGLEALGIRSVINLRMLRSDRHELHGTHLKAVNFAMVPWHVRQSEVIQFLKAATDTNNLPVFVHCEHGADRTGVMAAVYRVVVCGWSKEQAIAEMRDGGFAFSPTWKNLVRYVEQLDPVELRRRAGLPELNSATKKEEGG